MATLNKIDLLVTDKEVYRLFIDDVEIQNIKKLHLIKKTDDTSEITVTFKAKLKTKEK
ncbi:MAG TPA: hypothetical protein OIL95_13750 [Coprobacillaceae bacterium]|nr:hypothetical protein [Coprobacillaceae bacterium]